MKNIAKKIKTNTLKNGGGEFNIHNGKNPTVGYMIIIKDVAIIDLKDFTIKVLNKIINDNKKLLLLKSVYLGTWIDDYDNKVYIDIFKNYKNKNYCLKIAKKLRQLTILDLNTYTGINVKWS